MDTPSSPPTPPPVDPPTLHIPVNCEEQVDTMSMLKSRRLLDVFFSSTTPRKQNAARLWQKVARSTSAATVDPWKDMSSEVPTERAVEHLYDVKTESWNTRDVLVKVDTNKPVAEGAMRECYQLKIMQLVSQHVVLFGASQAEDGERSAKWMEMRGMNAHDVFDGIGPNTGRHIAGKWGITYRHLKMSDVLDRLVGDEERTISVVLSQVHDDHHVEEIRHDLKLLRRLELDDRVRWSHASLNFMGKRYKDNNNPKQSPPEPSTAATESDDDKAQQPDPDEKYRDDVVMQELCKVMAVDYNQQDPPPPKEIDFLHVGLIELVSRPEPFLIGYESYIQGDYHKWNTNSGWLDAENIRHTPHAISFFSYRQSKGALMIVDIQGVNDLYTDPQIHTANGTEFGDGNLGTRGMALFFNRFKYSINPIVQYLALEQFALAPGEQGPATEHELEQYHMGKKYLQSDDWGIRVQRKGSSHSGDFSADPPIEFEDGYRVRVDLESMYKLVPKRGDIPEEPVVEGKVHKELAFLHTQEDDRVLEGRICSTEEAVFFHNWFAARFGDVEAMQFCANETLQRGEDPLVSLAWHTLAAERGARASMIAVADALHERANKDTDLLQQATSWLKKATCADDGLSEAERKATFVPCNYELHMKLGYWLRDELADLVAAKTALQTASELAMDMGMFKLSTRLEEEVESLAC